MARTRGAWPETEDHRKGDEDSIKIFFAIANRHEEMSPMYTLYYTGKASARRHECFITDRNYPSTKDHSQETSNDYRS